MIGGLRGRVWSKAPRPLAVPPMRRRTEPDLPAGKTHMGLGRKGEKPECRFFAAGGKPPAA